MATSENMYDKVNELLGFSHSPGFIEEEKDTDNFQQKILLKEAKNKIGINAIYFIQIESSFIPIIYFKKLEKLDLEEIKKAHKLIWNQGLAHLLYV